MDAGMIAKVLELATTPAELKKARAKAKAAWSEFPHDGCAANLSALLMMAGVPIPMTLGAGDLAHRLARRGWERVKVGDQRPGDVGVTVDTGGNPGADHIYLVIEPKGADEMVIVDNQAPKPHTRFASGKGRTRTEYFLRATD